MKPKTCLLIAFSWLAALQIHCVAESPTPGSATTAPDAVKVPATESLSFTAHAKGLQIYECRAKKDDPAKYEWVFKGPAADLFDEQGKSMGRHYAGPTWESNDGSKIVGELKGKADATEAGAVPWLLLAVKAHEGSGVFSAVTYIQRVNTSGGKAPAECEEKSAGKEFRAPYSAVYLFYIHKQ
jgi:Protein of unknown function (DUF3455)